MSGRAHQVFSLYRGMAAAEAHSSSYLCQPRPVPLATAVNRELYRRVRPWFLNPDGTDGPLKSVYNLVGIIATSLTMNYLVMPFQVRPG